MTVAILGTGAMGAGMARSLLRAGIEVTVWNRTAERARPLAADGATVATGPAEAVADAEIVVTMLFDPDSTLAIAAEALPAMANGAIWVQSATIGIDGAARAVALAAEHQVAYLDVPVLGSKGPADQGTLVLLASGDPALRERVQPAFDAIGSRTIWLGENPGAGSRLKLVCNAWVGTLTAAVGQSVALAGELDLDPQLFLDAIAGSQSDSPYAQLKGRAMLADDLTPQFSVDGVRKDQRLIRDAIVDAGVSPRLIEAVLGCFDAASERGHGSQDMAAVVHGFAG